MKMNEDQRQKQKEELSRRIDKAILTGIQSLALLRAREEKEGLPPQILQLKYAVLAYHCDVVNAIKDRIRAEYGCNIFEPLELRGPAEAFQTPQDRIKRCFLIFPVMLASIT